MSLVKGAISLLTEIWECGVRMEVQPIQIFDVNFHVEPDREWVLTLTPKVAAK